MALGTLQERFRGTTALGQTAAEAYTPWEEVFHFSVAAGDTETLLSAPLAVPYDCDVIQVDFATATSIDDDTTDYITATVNCYTDTSTSVVVATIDTDASDGTEDIAAYVASSLTITDSYAALTEGQTLVCSIAPADTQSSWGASGIDVRVRRRAE